MTDTVDNTAANVKLVTVIPIAKGIFRDDLTYFTSKDISVGSLVTVPIGSRTVHGLVTDVQTPSDLKSALKNSSFGLRRVTDVQSQSVFLPEFVSAVEAAALYFASPIGHVMKSVVPALILSTLKDVPTTGESAGVSFHEKFALQGSDEERFSFYKSYIREEFAKKSSVFFCLPTVPDIERTRGMLERGINEHTVVLHHAIPRKQLLAEWEKAIKHDHPVLVVATPQFLCLPRSDIGTIITDFEQSSAYKEMRRPFLDFRWFAEQYALIRKIRYVVGDCLLRTETMRRKELGQFSTFIPLKNRSLSEAASMIVDMRAEKTETGEFSVLSRDLLATIRSGMENGERTFLSCARRGIASTTVCSDCGTTIACASCSSPLVLHAGREDNFFMCHHCHQVSSAEAACAKCGGWNLKALGIGIERVIDELRTHFPAANIYRFDSDTVGTYKEGFELAASFSGSKSSIMVGTEMALNYLAGPVDTVGVVTLDSLFSVPDYAINERIFYLLTRLRSLAKNRFIIQTREAGRKIFLDATRGNLSDFYRDELEERKRFNYPPFKTLIKITCEGPAERVAVDVQALRTRLTDHEPLVFPAFVARSQGKERVHILLRFEPDAWPQKELVSVLKAVPPSVTVDIKPDVLL